MSLNSVNTNIGAMVALQSLNRTNAEMEGVQKRISTGFRVADSRDDGAAFAVAERVRGDMAATNTANQQLGGVKGLLDVGRSGLENVSDALEDLRNTVLRLGGNDLTASQRSQYQTALKESISQIRNFLADSDYNGQTILTNGTAAGIQTRVKTIRNGEGDIYQFSTVNVKTNIIAHLSALVNGTAAGSLLGNTSTAIANAVAALTAGGRVSSAQTGTLDGLNAIGGFSKYVDRQVTFNKTRMDAQESGLGALIDADLAKESARLQALQIRQQLGTQALSIANQSPQSLMRLFQ
ncbi:flagellin [Roseococcus sp. DSY-14]|uniref:flagellin n=1 Tax=Roseococcus sp. DSY-14 TaxID=3369650 RepID=UPI00387AB3DD